MTLETLLAGTKRTKTMARNRAVQEEDWTTERRTAPGAVKEMLENAVTLACPKSGLLAMLAYWSYRFENMVLLHSCRTDLLRFSMCWAQ